MARYNHGHGSTLDDTANVMLLKADLHIAFDKPRFVFVPKPSDDRGMRLVIHLLGPSVEYEHYHHNRELHKSEVSADLLFGCFAWTVFPLLDAFLSYMENGRLTLWTATHTQVLSHGFFSALNSKRYSQSAAKKRSQSPKKRIPDKDVPETAPVDDAIIRTNSPASLLNTRKCRLAREANDTRTPNQLRGLIKQRKLSPSFAKLSPSSQSSSSRSTSSSSVFPYPQPSHPPLQMIQQHLIR